MSPQEKAFIQPDVGSATLHLSEWQSGGCPIRNFVIRYKPKYSAQWTDVPVKPDVGRDSYVLRALVPNREYDVMVTAHSEAGMTQADYSFRTLSTGGPTSSPAFGKRETDLPFYKNVALVIPVVVSSLVLVMVVFIIVVCLRKHNQDRRDYENRKDALMVKDFDKQINIKSYQLSHYSCPTGNKGDYAEPYTCIDSVSTKQNSDGLFATIKRCPTRPIYVSASYKQGSTPGQTGSFSCRPEGEAVQKIISNPESSDHPDAIADKWNNTRQSNLSQKQMR